MIPCGLLVDVEGKNAEMLSSCCCVVPDDGSGDDYVVSIYKTLYGY